MSKEIKMVGKVEEVNYEITALNSQLFFFLPPGCKYRLGFCWDDNCWVLSGQPFMYTKFEK